MTSPNIASEPAPSLRKRVVVSVAIGLAAAAFAFFLDSRRGYWPDFVFPWQAARYLLAGRDPYAVLHGNLPEPFETPLLYPLPTVLAAVPLARLSLAVAGAVLMGFSSALLAFVTTRAGWHRLWIFASAPLVMAVNLGQWSPLVTVAALEPALGALVTLKPNIGLAAFAYRPSRQMVIGAALVLLLSILVLPHWPVEWLRAVRSLPGHPAPILSLHGVGLVLLLAAFRWRTPEGRLLLVSACVPQLLFFSDQLPLLLVARTRRELLAMTAASQLGFVAWFIVHGTGGQYVLAATPYVLAFVFLPALAIVLRRSNDAAVNPVSESLER